jgi:hypothetical protein
MTAARPAPGTTATLNDRCVWPERRGLLCIVLDTTGAEHQYPVSGLGDNEVIVLVNADPLGPTSRLANGQPWSCCTSIDSLDVIGGTA